MVFNAWKLREESGLSQLSHQDVSNAPGKLGDHRLTVCDSVSLPSETLLRWKKRVNVYVSLHICLGSTSTTIRCWRWCLHLRRQWSTQQKKHCHLADIAFIKDPLQSKLYRPFFTRAHEKWDRYSSHLLEKTEPNRGSVFKNKMYLVGELSDWGGLC